MVDKNCHVTFYGCYCIFYIIANKEKVWNSVEVEELYRILGGGDITCHWLVLKVTQYFKDEIIDLRGDGIATLLV